MPPNGDPSRNYISVTEAQLGERVTNLGRRQSDLESEMRSGFRQVEQSITAFTNETRNSIAALSQGIAERNKPQWQALGVALTFAALIGGLAYMPIREATTDLKAAAIETNKSIQALAASSISRQEMDWRAARGAEDRVRQEQAITEMRAGTVTRAEWTERNRARDQEIADLSRRVEEIRSDFGSVYGTRDVIIDLKNEIDRLRTRLNERSPS